MTYAVEIQGLSFSYPSGSQALSHVNLKVQAGEAVAVVGPNGAGKSTLLLHLNGLLQGKGSVEVFGLEVKKKNFKEIRRRVGLVFQDPDDQLFSATVFDDVAFGPRNLGLTEEGVGHRARDALKKVGLEGFEELRPSRLSSGEKKRASIATVLSMDPDLLVFDEPTANLDPRARRELIELMKKLRSEGKAIIIATHDVDSITGVADRVVVLNKNVVAEGTAQEILLDVELLKRVNLEVPQVSRLFEVLEAFGYDVGELPLSIDEAIEKLTKTLDTEGGHVHLHVHEHTHGKLKEIREKHAHHRLR